MPTHPEPCSQAASPLFSLPPEIRDRIYSYYLSFDLSDFLAGETIRPTHVYLDEAEHQDLPDAPQPTLSRPLPPLLLTSRRAHAELAPRVRSHAAVRVRPRGNFEERRIGVAFRGVLRLARLRHLVLVVELEHASWNLWLAFFVGLAARAPGLEHLVVDWAPWDAEAESNGAVAWRRRFYAKKEEEFLATVESLKQLKTVKLYGRVPRSWKARLEEGTGARVTVVSHRWWSESWDTDG